MKKITDAMLRNDLPAAQTYSNKYLGMMNALFIETSPAPLKYVMNKLGLCENVFRELQNTNTNLQRVSQSGSF